MLAPPGDGVNVVVVGGSHSLSSLGIWLINGLPDSSYSLSRKCSRSYMKRLSQALSRGMSAGRDLTVSNLLSKITYYGGEIFPVHIFSTNGTREEWKGEKPRNIPRQAWGCYLGIFCSF